MEQCWILLVMFRRNANSSWIEANFHDFGDDGAMIKMIIKSEIPTRHVSTWQLLDDDNWWFIASDWWIITPVGPGWGWSHEKQSRGTPEHEDVRKNKSSRQKIKVLFLIGCFTECPKFRLDRLVQLIWAKSKFFAHVTTVFAKTFPDM